MAIPLGGSELVAVIDAADYPLVQPFTWFAQRGRATWYAMARKQVNHQSKKLYLHRLILSAPSGSVVDHIDHDGLNDRRSNLRLCGHSENAAYSRPRAPRSGLKGVRRSRHRHGGWEARCRVDGREVFFGTFPTASDAARAYDAGVRELRGPFAWTNEAAGLIPKSEA